MPKSARLVICAHPIDLLQLAAYNLDTRKQCLIPAKEISEVIRDCNAWDTQRLSDGIPFQSTMSAKNWALWLKQYEVASTSHLFVTLAKDGEFDDCISALGLVDKREIIAPPDQVSHLLADCHGFDETSFEQGNSVVCWIAEENWRDWLEMFEVLDSLHPDVAALLTP